MGIASVTLFMFYKVVHASTFESFDILYIQLPFTLWEWFAWFHMYFLSILMALFSAEI